MGLNPLKWARPIQVTAGLAVALLLYVTLTSGVSIAWARHIKNAALRGIASQISDIDRIEGESNAKEQAIESLARQTQELEAKAAKEHEARLELARQLEAAKKGLDEAKARVEAARTKDANRVPVTTLDGAVAAINKAIGK